MTPKLSPRELEALRIFAEGGSEKAAAKQMGVQLCTVKHFARSIRNKMETDKMIAAVSKSFRLGVLQ